MKIFVIIGILISLISCRSESGSKGNLSDVEWQNILSQTLPLAKGSKPYIYNKFWNTQTKDIVSTVYINCADLGYKLNDSIVNYINTREDNIIKARLDTMYNISFVSNLDGFDNNFVTYSEPFYVSPKILCISMSNVIVREDSILQWVFFFNNGNGSLDIIEFYDVNQDKFFKPINY